MEQTQTVRILVVDDDARVRRALRALIESAEGLAFAGEASTGASALSSADALAPDVVLLDLLLPSAEEGLRVLSSLVESGRVVVALTISEVLRRAALSAGAVAFVEKAAGADVLLGVLGDVRRRDLRV